TWQKMGLPDDCWTAYQFHPRQTPDWKFLPFLSFGEYALAWHQYRFFYVHGFLLHHAVPLRKSLHIHDLKLLQQIYPMRFSQLLEARISKGLVTSYRFAI